jgi:hypothetical protein
MTCDCLKMTVQEVRQANRNLKKLNTQLVKEMERYRGALRSLATSTIVPPAFRHIADQALNPRRMDATSAGVLREL